MSIPIIMDCDPGHDDAIALALALARPELELLAVTTCAGNQTLDKVTLNARKLLAFFCSPLTVARGAGRPLCRDLVTAAKVHGESGLDGPLLPEPVLPEASLSAAELMAKVIGEGPRATTIVATGPLTNVATFLLARPDLKARIGRIVLMGGSVAAGGNWTPAAEFNILVDPEAAAIVFDSGLPVVMCGLDVTHKAYATREDIERIRAGGPVSAFVAGLLDFFSRYRQGLHGLPGCPLHDPCAVACLLEPGLFESRRGRVHVERRGRVSTGATIVDWKAGDAANVEVLLDVDRGPFIDLVVEALRRLDARVSGTSAATKDLPEAAS